MSETVPKTQPGEAITEQLLQGRYRGPFTAAGYLASTHLHRYPLIRAIAYASRVRGARSKKEFGDAQESFSGAIQEAQAAMADPNTTNADKQRAELLLTNVRKELQAMENRSE